MESDWDKYVQRGMHVMEWVVVERYGVVVVGIEKVDGMSLDYYQIIMKS